LPIFIFRAKGYETFDKNHLPRLYKIPDIMVNRNVAAWKAQSRQWWRWRQRRCRSV